MKIGKPLGLLCGFSGIFAGAYLSIQGIYNDLTNGVMSGYDAGIALGLIGALVGGSFAVIGIIANKAAVAH